MSGSIHEGHRARMRARFAKTGFEGFAEHEVLEYLLYFALPRGDTNPLAHELIMRFGSLRAVFDATEEQLMQVHGVAGKTASLISMIPQLSRVYAESCLPRGGITTIEMAAEYMAPKLYGASTEKVVVLGLDNSAKPLFCEIINSGSVNSTGVDYQTIVGLAVKYGAVALFMAHNHPRGLALPSKNDVSSVRRLQAYLKTINIALVDHLVMVEGDYISMSQSGYFSDMLFNVNTFNSEELSLE